MSTSKRPADAYAIVRSANDPYLPMPPSPHRPGSVCATETHVELNRAWQHVKDNARRPDRLITIECLPHGCGPSRNRGAVLADVWLTPHGVLYVADIVFDRGHGDRQRLADGLTWVVMRHPDIEGLAEAHQEAFDQVWSSKGWELAPAGTEPPASWQPRQRCRVRDLLDRDDLDHSPLRCQCPGAGGRAQPARRRHRGPPGRPAAEIELDRQLLLGQVELARKHRRVASVLAMCSATMHTVPSR